MSVAKTILKRLFRVYAHIYHQHFDPVIQLQEEAHLNTSFKHFIFFVQVRVWKNFPGRGVTPAVSERLQDPAVASRSVFVPVLLGACRGWENFQPALFATELSTGERLLPDSSLEQSFPLPLVKNKSIFSPFLPSGKAVGSRALPFS